MEVAAKLKGARISAQKARLVADQVRGMPVEDALNLLESGMSATELLEEITSSGEYQQRQLDTLAHRASPSSSSRNYP